MYGAPAPAAERGRTPPRQREAAKDEPLKAFLEVPHFQEIQEIQLILSDGGCRNGLSGI